MLKMYKIINFKFVKGTRPIIVAINMCMVVYSHIELWRKSDIFEYCIGSVSKSICKICNDQDTVLHVLFDKWENIICQWKQFVNNNNQYTRPTGWIQLSFIKL